MAGVDKIIEQAKTHFDVAESFYSEEYQRGCEDVEFVFGKQWGNEELKQRKNRPSLVENRMLPFVHQVVNSVRQSNPSIIVQPVDDGADVETADVLKGMIKNIEVRSSASNTYDTALWNAATFCRGWIRVNTEYIKGTFDQDIYIDRIADPESVLLDPNHTFADGRDAEYAFIFEDMDRKEFENLYPKATDGFTDGKSTSWSTENTVRIAEYFIKTYEDVEIALTDEGVVDVSDLPEGYESIETRTDRRCTIKWYKLTDNEVLEETSWLGSLLPIVPVLGVESWLDGKRQAFSLINQAKDPQKMLNYWKSAHVEVVAMQPKAPWVAPVGSFNTFGKNWAESNTANIAALQYDVTYDKNGMPLPAPTRQMPPQGSPLMAQEAMLAGEGIKASLGMYDASMGMSTSEVSGSAIKQRTLQGDNSTFHFIDNLGVALQQIGRILVDLIPKIYSEPRIARIIGEDGIPALIPINQPYVKNQDGNLVPAKLGVEGDGYHSLDLGKYDVVVDVGASYATRRQEAVNSMLEVAGIDPRIMEVAPDIFFENLDIPNSKELAKRVKTLIDPALLEDDPMALKLQEAMQVSAQMAEQIQGLEMALQAREETKEADLMLKKADQEMKNINSHFNNQKTKAETDKIYDDINKSQVEVLQSDVIEKISDGLADVSQAVELILDNENKEQPQAIIESNPLNGEKEDDRS